MSSTERANCWSITINNLTDEDLNVELPPGYTLQGQMEVGEDGTEHYQGMLTTPQVRFSAIKKLFTRAHIEVARNRAALQKYVHKEETRIATVETRQGGTLITPYNINSMIVERWNESEWDEHYKTNEARASQLRQDPPELMLAFVDMIIRKMIREGLVCEYVGVNPQFRSAWKNYGESILCREKKRIQEYKDGQGVNVISSAQSEEGIQSLQGGSEPHSEEKESACS